LQGLLLTEIDHDIDGGEQQINVYNARGILFESRGPSWIYSVSNEHSTLYNWQFYGAQNVFVGGIQSESPYFQNAANVTAHSALEPYTPGQLSMFPEDPTFPDCEGLNATEAPGCQVAWALRVVKSTDIVMHGGGFYSFFTNYDNACSRPKSTRTCQQKLVETSYSCRLHFFSVWTVGSQQMISPQGFASNSFF
jgi:glucan 1,3-beta-glucosidase